MFHSLTLSNWDSFKDPSTLSLVGGKSVDGDSRFTPSSIGGNIARTAVIFGANASGKTNFLKAFSFLSWFIKHSWQAADSRTSIPFSPFRFNKEPRRPTTFELVTEDSNKTVYYYTLSLTQKSVLSESLSAREAGTRRRRMLFSREGEEYHRYPGSGFTLKDLPLSVRRRNASFISAVRQTELNCFDGFLETMRIRTNVDFSGRIERTEGFEFKELAHNESMRKRVEQLLSSFDTGISELKIKTQKAKDNPAFAQNATLQQKIAELFGGPIVHDFMNSEIYRVTTIHQIDGQAYSLPFSHESNGTEQLVRILPQILKVLHDGAVLVYDELEHGIHPNLLPLLLELFYSPSDNQHGAQLICTCHTADIMHTLDKRQIAFTQKNGRQESELYMLSDFNQVRNDDNFVAKYLSGVYGGIPRI